MSATTAGALKAYLEAQGLGVPAFRDEAPEGQALPYVTVDEAVALIPDASGDTSDPDADRTLRETVTVHLWQQWRKRDKTAGESYTLPRTLLAALERAGQQLTAPPESAPPTRVYGTEVLAVARLVERSNNVVHHAYTVRISRAA